MDEYNESFDALCGVFETTRTTSQATQQSKLDPTQSDHDSAISHLKNFRLLFKFLSHSPIKVSIVVEHFIWYFPNLPHQLKFAMSSGALQYSGVSFVISYLISCFLHCSNALVKWWIVSSVVCVRCK